MAVTINGGAPKRVASKIGFPYTDLGDAIAVAEGMLKGGGVALTRDQLAAALNMSPAGGGFGTRVATARMFGVIDAKDGKYELTEIGFEIMDPSRQSDAKIKAFLNVPLYKKIYDEFRGKLLPPRPHGLDNAIVNFGVTEKLARAARLAFEKSARIAGFYPGGNEDRLVMPFGNAMAAPVESDEPPNTHQMYAPDVTIGGGVTKFAPAPSQPLEYQLVDLLKTEGIGEQESQAIWTLVRFLSTRKTGDNGQ